MKNIIVYLNLILLTSLGYAQVDLKKFRKAKIDKRNFNEISNFIIYSKDGNITKYDSASFENEDSNIYVFTKSGNTLVFLHNNLDSLVSRKNTLSFVETQEIAQRRIKKDPMIKKNSSDIRSLKGDLTAFSRMRNMGYILSISGNVITIAAATSESSEAVVVGGVVGLVGWIIIWKSGDIVNYNLANKRRIRR